MRPLLLSSLRALFFAVALALVARPAPTMTAVSAVAAISSATQHAARDAKDTPAYAEDDDAEDDEDALDGDAPTDPPDVALPSTQGTTTEGATRAPLPLARGSRAPRSPEHGPHTPPPRRATA